MFNLPSVPMPTGNTSKTNLFSGLGDFLGGLPWGNIAKTGLSYAAVENMMDRLGDAGKAAVEGSTALGTEVREGMKFKPFTVTTGTGTVTTTPEGGFTTALGDQGAAQTTGVQNILSGMLGSGYSADPTGGMAGTIGNQAFGGVGNLLSSVTGDRGAREQQIYDRIRATQTPEEDRQRQLLNDQLLSQGRLGLSTAMFGGSPEQFAQEKARAEAMNQASLAAMGQAGQERAQDLATATGLFGLGGQASQLPLALQSVQGQNLAQMMGLQYAPERQLLDSLTQGVNVAQLADLGRRSGQSLFADTGMAGLEGMLSTDMARANLIGNIYSSLLGGAGAGATQAGGGSWLGDLIGSGGSWLGEQLGKIGT